MKTKMFDWIKPAALRKSPALAEKDLITTLAGVSSSAAYRALMELLADQFQAETLAALSNSLTPEQRTFQAGRAAALHGIILRIEGAREEAQEQMKNEEGRMKK
jgi:predicted protein tyrosine phosphatase